MLGLCRTICFGVVRRRDQSRVGFTLLEVLMALTITLILLGTAMELFKRVSEGITNSRSVMELHDQLRHAKHRLILDLRGTTAPTVPPLPPEMHLGYFVFTDRDQQRRRRYRREPFRRHFQSGRQFDHGRRR